MKGKAMGITDANVPLVQEEMGIDAELCLEHGPVMNFLAKSEKINFEGEIEEPEEGEGFWAKAKRLTAQAEPVVMLAIETKVLIGVKNPKRLRPNALIWMHNRIQAAVREAITVPPS